MSDETEQPSSFSINAIMYMAFRNKWFIIAGITIGAIAAALTYIVTPLAYRSEAKLLVRYVNETLAIDPELTGGQILKPGRSGDSIINTEIEILTSADTAERSVRQIGLDGIMGHDQTKATNIAAAASFVLHNLRVEAPKNSNVIRAYFDGPTPAIAQQILTSVVQQYLEKHLEVHKDAGAFEFLSQQTDQIRAKLAETEEELKRLKNESGIVSLPDAKASISARMNQMDNEIRDTETSLAGTRAKIEALRSVLSTRPTTTPTSRVLPSTLPQQLSDLRSVRDRMNALRMKEAELLAIYTSDSPAILNLRAEYERLEAQLSAQPIDDGATNSASRDLVDRFSLADQSQSSLLAEQAVEASLVARLAILKQQAEQAREEAKKIETVETAIVRLDRTREMQEATYKYFSQRLEQARVDNALDSSKVSNIAVLQPPTLPSGFVQNELMRTLLLILFGCTGAGVACGLVRELVLDHSIRRPEEVEKSLHVPLLMTIPILPSDYAGTPPRGRGSRNKGKPRQASVDASLRPYAEALRDRLELAAASATSPRLIGIAACDDGAGVTSLCRTVAGAFANGGDSRILLVTPSHMTSVGLLQAPAAEGAAAEETPPPQDNAVVLSREAEEEDDQEPGPSRTFDREAIGNLKAGAYDLVLFDLPFISDTSPALRMSPYLDGIVFVCESERSLGTKVQRAIGLLRAQGVPVIGVVLNKYRPYLPRFFSTH